MGFDPISLGAMAVAGTQVAGSLANARAQRQAARDVNKIAEANNERYEARANVMKEEALENASRMRKNANAAMGRTRLQNSGRQAAADGSVALQEMDMASRLENEVLDETRKSLYEIDQLKSQVRVDSMEAQSRARSYRSGASVSLLSGFADAGRTIATW